MGLIAKAKQWFRPKPVRTVRYGDTQIRPLGPDVADDISRQSARRFIQPDRLNAADWLGVHGQSINIDLQVDLPQLMARCGHLFALNPLFAGVCNTYCQDVVGPNGPTLQVQSDDQQFNDEVEWAFRKVFEMPDPAGRLDGVENMKMWVRLLLTAGSYINIFGTRRRTTTESTFAWRTIHPRRLITPMKFVGDDNVAFGIRINADGAPVRYYIDNPRRFGSSEMSVGEYSSYPAEMVQHRYFSVEPEQLTGYPLMAPTLETFAELRRLDGHTMDAAQSAAAHSWWLQSADPTKVVDPDPVPAGGTYPMQRGAVNVAPAGWVANGMAATQPNSEGIAYRHERLAECGRPINMPLLIVLLSVNEATFSSAQFAGALYIDGIKGVQGFIARTTLNPIVEMIATDLVIAGKVKRPEWYECAWTQNAPPHANIEKFVAAIEKMVSNGFISMADASAMLGFDFEKVITARKRCQDMAEALELPVAPVNAGNPPKPEPEPGEETPPAKKPAKAKPQKRNRRARARVATR